MLDKGNKHRVIGIRHTLKKLKEAGFLEDDVLYPDDAVDDLGGGILSIAQKWYGIGARRGALEVLEAFLDGKFQLEVIDGKIEIVASGPVKWKRSLRVTVGNKKMKVSKQEYKLHLKDIGFD